MYFNVDADINVHGPGSSAERTEYCKTWQEKERDRQYYKQRLAKWKQQQATVELKSETFKGVTVWISGYTDKSSDLQLKTLVTQHGGQISWFFSATRTTHIICTNLAAAKIDRMLKRASAKRFIPVVHPDWILHSVKQRKLLPEHDYRVIQPTNQHQIDQFFAKKTEDINEADDEDSISDISVENSDKPRIIPRPIYSPKKTYNTTPLKFSPKKEKKQIINETKVTDNTNKSNDKEDTTNAIDTSSKDKENFVPIEGSQEANCNNKKKEDKALKNIDIRTGKVIKTSTTSAVQVKKTSSKPLAKLSLLANDQFKNIPNVAKKSGPVKK